MKRRNVELPTDQPIKTKKLNENRIRNSLRKEREREMNINTDNNDNPRNVQLNHHAISTLLFALITINISHLSEA